MPQLLPSSRCVAGLDTAANRFHLYCNTGMRCSLVIPDRPKLDPDERRHMLHDAARQAFRVLPRGTVVVAEEPLALRNGKTTRLLALAAGAIWAAHLNCDIYWTWADVATWKRVVIGRGDADKAQIETWVRENMGLEFDEADFYDAAALCRYGEIKLDGR